MACKQNISILSEREEGELTDTSRLVDDDDDDDDVSDYNDMMEVENIEEKVSPRKRVRDHDAFSASTEKKSLRNRQNSESSLSTTSSGTQRKEMEMETNPTVLARRQKEIDYGKNTIGYDRYIQMVPKYKRTKDHPKTPPKYAKYSRRAWDGLVKIWRKQLHQWDPENNTEESKANGSDNASDTKSVDSSDAGKQSKDGKKVEDKEKITNENVEEKKKMEVEDMKKGTEVKSEKEKKGEVEESNENKVDIKIKSEVKLEKEKMDVEDMKKETAVKSEEGKGESEVKKEKVEDVEKEENL